MENAFTLANFNSLLKFLVKCRRVNSTAIFKHTGDQTTAAVFGAQGRERNDSTGSREVGPGYLVAGWTGG